MDKLVVKQFAQIRNATINFQDLTFLVGPQATGKSLLLQLLKFAIDKNVIASDLKDTFKWNSQQELLATFLGEGYEAVASKCNGESIKFNGKKLLGRSINRIDRKPASVFFLPAQRVLAFDRGWPRGESSYDFADPYVVKEFGAVLRKQFAGFSEKEPIFPTPRKLTRYLRDAIEESIFHRGKVHLQEDHRRKHFVLSYGERKQEIRLPFLEWSAGQREATPLLLGLYDLIPGGGKTKNEHYEWVVIEEPEMGLHPKAINAVLMLAFELLKRGYKVVISTHSPHILEVAWMLRTMSEQGPKTDAARKGRVLAKAFGQTNPLASANLFSKIVDKKVAIFALGYGDGGKYFCKDISTLDPESDDPDVAGWGGLTASSSRVMGAVADYVAQSVRGPGKTVRSAARGRRGRSA